MLSHSRKPKAQLDCTLSKLEKLSRARPVSTSLPPSTLVSPRRQRKSCPSDIFNTRLARLKCLESQFSILSSRTSWVSKKSPDFIFDPGAAQKVQDPKKKSSATYFFPTRTQHLTDPGKCHSPLKSSSFLDFFHVAVCQVNP